MGRTKLSQWYFLLCFCAAMFIVLFLTMMFFFGIFYFHYPISRVWIFLVMAGLFLWAAKEMWDGFRDRFEELQAKPTDSTGPNIPPYGVS